MNSIMASFVCLFHLMRSLYEYVKEIKAMCSLVLYLQCVVGDEDL